MRKVAKGLIAAVLIAVIAAGRFVVYRLANPLYEENGIAILAVRRTTSSNGKKPILSAYFQNRRGEAAYPLVFFALLDDQGEMIGFAEGEKYGETGTPDGWFGVVDCRMVKFENMTLDWDDLSIEEQTEGVASWVIAAVY